MDMARRLSFAAGAMALALLCLAVPAGAHHKAGHDGGPGSHGSGDHDGDADNDSSTSYTEDNDSDGKPNSPDPSGDADNKHPSGKDKHEEHGNSGNQGASESDPDDDGHGPDRSNGGPDKPNGSGGEDLLDQDGNNGCGNDDDFEDDNEGWCGKPPKQDEVAATEEIDSTQEAATTEGVVSAAQPTRERPAAARHGAARGESSERPGAPGTEVLGSRMVRGESGASLPFTGGSVMALLAGALALIACGVLLVQTRRN
jgi:hypothetical protein